MNKLYVLFFVFLTSCSVIPNNSPRFEMTFGVPDKSNTINPTDVIYWEKGSYEKPYGVYIRRIKPIEYELSFTVSRFDSKSKRRTLIEKCGTWIIRWPNNPNYSALISHVFDNEVEYGEYVFDVYVDNKLEKSFVYQVLPPKN